MSITLLDGAMGTGLWALADEAGIEKVPVWKYNIEHPELVETMNRRYLEAGSQVIQANTFGANGPAVKHSSDYDPADVVAAGVRIAKKVAEGTDVKVAISFGPLTELLEPYGDLEEDECFEIYDTVIKAGVEAGADMVILETFLDIEMSAIAAKAALQYGKPVICSMTFEKVGKTMMGNSVQDAIDKLVPLGIAGIGMNCSLGPDQALPIIKEFSEKTDTPLFYKPNAGLPVITEDGSTIAAVGAKEFAEYLKPAVPFVSYIGGCCGSDPEYIKEIKKIL